MKVGASPENLIEQGVMAIGQVPIPSIETQGSMMLAQTIIVATQLGVFEALSARPLNVQDIAVCCGANAGALKKLLNALAGTGYLLRQGEIYELAPISRKWLLKENEISLHDFVISRVLLWQWLPRLEEFVRTGESIQIHQEMNLEQLHLYHRGMRSLASLLGPDVAAHTPVPPKAKDLLELGGSHGYFSVTLCRAHPGLRGVILELPEAIEVASPLLAKDGMGDRIVYQAGDILTTDLGTNTYDLIFASNLLHHFDEATSISLFQRIARALRPGGYFVVQKTGIPSKEDGQLGSFIDLFFSLTSAAGNWSLKEIAEWQRQVGLVPQKPMLFKTSGSGQQVAMKL